MPYIKNLHSSNVTKSQSYIKSWTLNFITPRSSFPATFFSSLALLALCLITAPSPGPFEPLKRSSPWFFIAGYLLRHCIVKCDAFFFEISFSPISVPSGTIYSGGVKVYIKWVALRAGSGRIVMGWELWFIAFSFFAVAWQVIFSYQNVCICRCHLIVCIK